MGRPLFYCAVSFAVRNFADPFVHNRDQLDREIEMENPIVQILSPCTLHTALRWDEQTGNCAILKKRKTDLQQDLKNHSNCIIFVSIKVSQIYIFLFTRNSKIGEENGIQNNFEIRFFNKYLLISISSIYLLTNLIITTMYIFQYKIIQCNRRTRKHNPIFLRNEMASHIIHIDCSNRSEWMKCWE